VIPKNDVTRTGWSAEDVVNIRLTTDYGAADTLISRFVVQADKLANAAAYDFKDLKSYYALFAGTEVAAKDTVVKKTDVVFYVDTTTTRTDSTFVLKMVASESCKIAVVASDSASFAENLRTNGGAQDDATITYGTPTNTITIPSSAHISITGYQYYAVKITIGADSKLKTYYGYLRLRTHLVAPSKGDPYKFDRVEFTLRYGEARDYTKE
jgi:hypothetical protein